MDTALLKTVGQIAGIGGLAIGTFLILFRDVLRKTVFSSLSANHSFRLLRLIVILVWSVAIVGIMAWCFATRLSTTYLTQVVREDRGEKPNPPQELQIVGRVLEQGSGISGANIIDANSGEETKSDASGRFALRVRETQVGWARIQVFKEGYEKRDEYVETTRSVMICPRQETIDEKINSSYLVASHSTSCALCASANSALRPCGIRQRTD